MRAVIEQVFFSFVNLNLLICEGYLRGSGGRPRDLATLGPRQP
jgi:hypothetical protein